MKVLQEASAMAMSVKVPGIIAGDWNNDPPTLDQASWLRMTDGTAIWRKLPTCNGSTHEYFVVSKYIAHLVAGVQRLDDGG